MSDKVIRNEKQNKAVSQAIKLVDEGLMDNGQAYIWLKNRLKEQG